MLIIKIFVACKFSQPSIISDTSRLLLYFDLKSIFITKVEGGEKKNFLVSQDQIPYAGNVRRCRTGVDGTNEATGRRNVSRISRTFVACTCGKERDYEPRLYSGSGLDDADSTAESQILDRFQGIVCRAHAKCARETASSIIKCAVTRAREPSPYLTKAVEIY